MWRRGCAQAKVTAKAAAHLAEQRWWWQRLADTLRDRQALAAWAQAMVPDTIAEWWSIILVALVGVFVVSCINTLAQSAKAQEDARAAAGEGNGAAGAAAATGKAKAE